MCKTAPWREARQLKRFTNILPTLAIPSQRYMQSLAAFHAIKFVEALGVPRFYVPPRVTTLDAGDECSERRPCMLSPHGVARYEIDMKGSDTCDLSTRDCELEPTMSSWLYKVHLPDENRGVWVKVSSLSVDYLGKYCCEPKDSRKGGFY